MSDLISWYPGPFHVGARRSPGGRGGPIRDTGQPGARRGETKRGRPGEAARRSGSGRWHGDRHDGAGTARRGLGPLGQRAGHGEPLLRPGHRATLVRGAEVRGGRRGGAGPQRRGDARRPGGAGPGGEAAEAAVRSLGGPDRGASASGCWPCTSRSPPTCGGSPPCSRSTATCIGSATWPATSPSGSRSWRPTPAASPCPSRSRTSAWRRSIRSTTASTR